MHDEREVRGIPGWPVLLLDLAVYALAIWLFVQGARNSNVVLAVVGGVGTLLVALFLTAGLFVVDPNESKLLLLFGAYRGTVKKNGFWWANPLMSKIKVSLRVRTLNGAKLKVNDRNGNPVEIAAVVVWQVHNTSMAQFDVDNYIEFVHTQSEAAVRHLASAYPYDGADEVVSLRGATEEVNHNLLQELQNRLSRAGVSVVEARISHLAYAPEIAGAMLQRQQADAVIAARKKIVEGAVGMVEDALKELTRMNVVDLDEERKASMVSNLLVVLCSEHATQPVINTGTLYS